MFEFLWFQLFLYSGLTEVIVRMQSTIVLIALVIVATTTSLQIPPQAIDVIQRTPLGCNRQVYTYLVTQVDSNGYECSDNVSVQSCWGRCDSSEISDWKFPYKRSFHPVCMHAGRQKSVAILKNCHPLAGMEARRYEFMEPVSCTCQMCTSKDTSCEAPIHLRDGDGVRVLALGGDDDNFDY